MIQSNESRDPNGSNVSVFSGDMYVTMQITFLRRIYKLRSCYVCNLYCDVHVAAEKKNHITAVWDSSLTLDCQGVFCDKGL